MDTSTSTPSTTEETLALAGVSEGAIPSLKIAYDAWLMEAGNTGKTVTEFLAVIQPCDATARSQDILKALSGVISDIQEEEDLNTNTDPNAVDDNQNKIPVNPLYGELSPPRDIKDLTSVPTAKGIREVIEADGTVHEPGTGDLDKLTKALSNQLDAIQQAFGLDLAGKAAVLAQALPAVMNIGVQYNLNKDATRWDAITAQFRARESEIRAKTALYELTTAKNDAETNRVNLARSIIELAVVDKQHEITCEKLIQERDNTLIIKSKLAQEKSQETVIVEQIAQIKSATMLSNTQIRVTEGQINDQVMQPLWKMVTDPTTGKEVFDLDAYGFRKQATSPSGDLLFAMGNVEGTVGRQNTLLNKQTEAYDLDSKQKYARLFVDMYAIDKSADSGVQTPEGMGNKASQYIMTQLGESLGLLSTPATPSIMSTLPTDTTTRSGSAP